jgi:membrane protein implicated in regulation of membrane protease activity
VEDVLGIFLTIMLAGIIVSIGGSLFGHDHDGGFDHDHDHDHGHDAGSGNEPAVSVFSTKVIGTFVSGFGAGGAIAQYLWGNIFKSSLAGVLVGAFMAAIMYAAMKLLYSQQSTSLVQTGSLVGRPAMVTSEIDANSIGQVSIRTGLEAPTYLARAAHGKHFAKGTAVVVVATNGAEVVVDDVQN